MNTIPRIGMNHMCLPATLFLFVAFGASALEFDPPQVLINTLKSVAVVRLTNNGVPLTPGDIKGYRFLVDDSNYAHMITMTPVDGGVRIAPTESLEVGSYELLIDTKKGSVTVPVSAPLSGEEGMLEQRSRALGGAKDEAMKDLGLVSPLPRGTVHFTLASGYQVGQVAAIDLPVTAGVDYRWLVNGQTVAEGAKALAFAYVFPAEGDYTISLEQRDAGGAWKPASEAHTFVTESPVTPVTSKPGQRVNFAAPEGYGKYTWTLEGKMMGDQRTLGLAFPNPGKQTLVCRCEQLAGSQDGGFFDVRYEITVQ